MSASAVPPDADSSVPTELLARPDLGALGRPFAIECDGQNAAARRAAMLHARDDFLAHVATLLETDAAQLIEIGLMRETLARPDVGARVAESERDARGFVVD